MIVKSSTAILTPLIVYSVIPILSLNLLIVTVIVFWSFCLRVILPAFGAVISLTVNVASSDLLLLFLALSRAITWKECSPAANFLIVKDSVVEVYVLTKLPFLS